MKVAQLVERLFYSVNAYSSAPPTFTKTSRRKDESVSKFNPASRKVSVENRKDAIQNFEGGLAFKLDPKTRLYTRVCTSLFGEDKFYQTGEQHNAEIINDIYEVAKVDPEFILKLAAYARNEMHLRSVPIVLLAEAAAINECKPFVRKWARFILRRADEPLELIAYWTSRHGSIGDRGEKGGEHAFPNCLKKAVADALNKFDEYEIEKYNRENRVVKMRDALRICHPKPKDNVHNALFNYIITGNLSDKEKILPKLIAKEAFLKLTEFNDEAKKLIQDGSITWEVAISKFGNKPEVWDALNLPIMAAVRNLRNIILSGASIENVIDKLTNPEIIKKSKLLPFRFYAAYLELKKVIGDCWKTLSVEQVRKINTAINALETAVKYSVANLPKLYGTTLIACDNSGSMDSSLSRKSIIKYCDIANLFGALATEFCENAIVGVFANIWRVVPLLKSDSIFTKVDTLKKTPVGYSTYAYRIFEWLLNTKNKVDRIILLSDLQAYHEKSWRSGAESVAEQFAKYRRVVNNDVILYSVDLAGYGTTQVPQDVGKVALISGWSENIFRFMEEFEKGFDVGVKAVEDYVPAC